MHLGWFFVNSERETGCRVVGLSGFQVIKLSGRSKAEILDRLNLFRLTGYSGQRRSVGMSL